MSKKTNCISKILVLDVETNGIGAFRPVPTQDIVQIGMILGEQESCFFVQGVKSVNPSVPHDITPEICAAEGLSREEACSRVLKCIYACDVIVGHNIEFDLGCLYHTFSERRADLKSAVSCKEIVCTMHSTTSLCKIPFPNAKPWSKRYKWPKLEELYVCLFGSTPDAKLHDALEDCRVTKKCYDYLEEGLA